MKAVELQPGKWRARTRYRFDDGSLRQVERFAPTKAKAIAALQLALTTITAQSAGDVKRQTTIAELAEQFMRSKASRSPRTVDTYRNVIDRHIVPRLGKLAVSEVTADRVQRFIDAITAEVGPGAAKQCRVVLGGMLGLAARSDAIRHNPVREVAPIAQARTGASAIPLADLPILLERVRGDERLRSVDQADLIEFLAATGARIGEVCALAWDDVDLEAGTVTIRANVVRSKASGLVRQTSTKTKAGTRTIRVPDRIIGMLGDRRIRLELNPHGLVFPTVLGNLRDPRNTAREWEHARGRLGFPNVSSHSFRKTVATALDQAGLSARDIAEYLGHENPSLTQDVYMAKNTGAAKAASAMGDLLN